MKNLLVATILLMICLTSAKAQELTQTISGKITDHQTDEPLPFVNVYIKDSSPAIGTISDENGFYTIKNVLVGRVTVEASYMGYEPLTVSEVVVTSAKSVQLNMQLTPGLSSLDEVVIAPKANKERPINNIATVSARMLSVEEASRYAGGFDDPARLASSFAGVAGGGGADNAIIIRGNAPKFLQWKIEGVEIPNPNHFANLSSFGGGGLTALSSNLLANSDFMTGAFPSEYNNVLAGVFDMRMRTGNSVNYEHSFEVGLIGLDFASEGPISRASKASYLINYRFSSLALLESAMPDDAQGTKYQDLSFKLNFPTKKAGIFSLWGIGLIDKSGSEPEKNENKREYYQDIENQDVKQYMGALGLNHNYYFANSAYLKSILAFSSEGLDLTTDRLNEENALVPKNSIASSRYNLTFKSYYNRRFSEVLSNRTGIILQGLGYDLDFNEANNIGELQNIAKESGFTSLMAAFTNFTLRKNKFNFNLGLTSQIFTLNNSFTLEPRLGAAYQINPKHSLSFGYGLHSRLEPLQIYFTQTPNSSKSQANKDLGFTKAHHFVLGYDWNISEKLHLKIEPYYQILYNVPMAANSNESLLNLQSDWFITDTFYNTGEGRNYGLDITFEQYMNNGFYYLLSGSVFNSEFKNKNTDWFNTRFNKNYVFNALAGKEFKLGKNKQHTLGINVRFSLQGGSRYSKIDMNASMLQEEVVYDETNPFSEQTDPSAVLHTTLSYVMNRKKTSHKFSIKILNATGYEDFLGHRYNFKTGKVIENREALMLPNVSYKISF
ncbi:MAG: TonB-dependent receptor [Aequorivita sp.]|nr:TonB-dependent receptor [Aequorivita sp.]